jgi:hypothetical protein
MNLVLASLSVALVFTMLLVAYLYLPKYSAMRFRWWVKAAIVPVSLFVIFTPFLAVSLEEQNFVLSESSWAWLLFVHSAAVSLMGVFLFLILAKETPKLEFDKNMRVVSFFYRAYRIVIDVAIPAVLVLAIFVNLYSALNYL